MYNVYKILEVAYWEGVCTLKYGESAFDLLYLLTAVMLGCLMLKRAHTKTERLVGRATLVLGCGDAFHLVPRVLNYFVAADFTAALGLGKLVTSLTMTVFYVYMYCIYLGHYGAANNKKAVTALYALTALRIILCLFPQNGWLQNGGSFTWALLRNLPFFAIGAIIAYLYFRHRRETWAFRHIWLYVALSFLFYIPVALSSGALPMLGMLMLPKTVCYILMIITFYRSIRPSGR